jgi:hypothetical protein
MPGLGTVAAALNEANLPLAQIAALHLRLPDLVDRHARTRLAAEDVLIKSRQGNGWDEAKHPRTGTPPNRAWFAPKPGPATRPRPTQTAQRGRGEREPVEILDPTAPVRQAVWDARIALLRRIDPNNPNLTYFANPGSAPNQAALNHLDAAIEAASVGRVTDRVMPNGTLIGRSGGGEDVRELPGDAHAAAQFFEYLSVGGTIYRSEPNLTIVKLPGKSSFIVYRPVSRSGSPAVEINVPPIPFTKFHFIGGRYHENNR